MFHNAIAIAVSMDRCDAGHGLQRDSTVTMCARLKGGAPAIPGEWFCQVCQRGGCWPARTNCFRCCCKRSDQVFKGAPLEGPARERQGMGRSPPQGSQGCPTERRPPPPQGARKPVQGKLDQHAIMEALGNLGLLQTDATTSGHSGASSAPPRSLRNG